MADPTQDMSMLEKCCRAACNVLHDSPDPCGCGSGTNCEYWPDELEKVRAVLNALLDPDAGLMNVESPLGPMDRAGHWRAMVRYILNPCVSDGNPVGEDAKRLRDEVLPARSDEVGDALIERVRAILAGTDLGSLPNDYPLDQMAADRMERIKDLTLEGLGLIGKAEALSSSLAEATADAARYQRLRILGCAPMGTDQLKNGTVLCFQSLDGFLDADMKAHPSRGEAALAALSKGGSDV